MTITTYLSEVRTRAELAGSMTSDDFGHDTQALLEAELRTLQVIVDDVGTLANMLEQAATPLTKIESDRKMTIADPSESFKDGAHDAYIRQADFAKAALNDIAESLNGRKE